MDGLRFCSGRKISTLVRCSPVAGKAFQDLADLLRNVHLPNSGRSLRRLDLAVIGGLLNPDNPIREVNVRDVQAENFSDS